VKRQSVIAFVSALVISACGGGGGFEPDDNPGKPASVSLSPENTGDGWSTSTPADEGLNTQQLSGIFDSIRNGVFPGVDSMLVIRNQRLVAEGYFNGFDRDTLHDLRSTGKSFTSALAGIAIDQGLIDLDERVSQLIPNYEGYANMDDRKRAITVHHLLNMSSSLDCNDWDPGSPGNEERMYDRSDWVKFILDLRMVQEPGAVTSYCTGGVVVLGAAIAQRAAMGLDRYADTWLFGPLGVSSVEWRRSPDGSATGGGGLKLRPRDAAKFGALFANEGVWNGRRIVPESWVQTTRSSPVALRNNGYGFLWWKTTFQLRGQPLEAVFTSGNGGNFIFYIPTQELVVVFTGSNYNKPTSDTPLNIMPLVISALP
jgi:CubicO group peptidase (beta-lactamase class C family)